MALVTITGYPCSGKTKRVQQLTNFLEGQFRLPEYSKLNLKIVVISDDSLNLPRSVYNDTRSEKPARGALFSTVQRYMNPSTIVILDSLNYIKGFRYQLYCAAKETGVRVCTLFIAAMPNQCIEWNNERDPGFAYTPDTLENLIMRYEEPSSMVRWDSPLFTIPWDETELPKDQIWFAITQGDIKPANVGTRPTPQAPTDALQVLENTTVSIISSITSEQITSGGTGGTINISFPTNKFQISLPARTITFSELQRLKRAFINMYKKVITQGAAEQRVDFTEESIARKFIEYLEQNMQA
ncbi:hypothetical protein Clacol_000646 [Clathrus columnatus]|uniref:Chromatin associated protein KTI12 n=1 Tax=Clathrus columnatus TaxID=1419009 RepID=A0AAV4ZZK0_9AGAM|nr:hypothetical protein Clacol_000646 [Clathrus columnatus]